MFRDVYRQTKDGINKRWERLPEDKISKWVEMAKSAQSKKIFYSIQLFSTSKHTEGEEQISDLWFDFDGETAQEDTVKVIDYFIDKGVDNAYIKVWFSGNKGFHLCFSRRLFGALSHPELNKIWRNIVYDIQKAINVPTLDVSIYKSRGAIRIENTQHQTSNLYKIPLLVEEIKSLPLGEIKRIAEASIPSHFEEYDGEPILNELYQKAITSYESHKAKETWEIDDVTFDNPPPCISAILTNGVFQVGTVNMTCFRLAAFFKSQGIELGETRQLLFDWAEHIEPKCTHDLRDDGSVDLESIRDQVKYVCTTVYANDNYGFSCQGIKQIPGVEQFCTEECKDSLIKEIKVSLFDAFKVEYLGRRLSIEAEAIGRRDTFYAIPKDITIMCTESTDTAKCKLCPLYGNLEGLKVKISARNSSILKFLELVNIPITARISAVTGVPVRRICDRWVYRIDQQNIEVVYLAPCLGNQFTSFSDEQYIRESIYHIGYGLEPNRRYKFSGYSHVDNRGKVILVLDSAEPLEDTLNQFIFTDEMKKASKIFSLSGQQTYKEKHDSIIGVINNRAIHLWGRESMLKAMDLAYHSVRRFWFQKELINGRIDCIIIGDTGQGKSTAAEVFMKYYNLGIKVSGEAAGRTGLLYTIHHAEGEPPYIVWGVLPRHHGRLVFIDELKELIKNGGFDELTEARSSGIVDVTRTVVGKALAETRLVMMTNARDRKPMGSYNYPVMSLQELIPGLEDIRRCTYVVGVKSAEIEDALINQNIYSIPEEEDLYPSGICHNHIMWVWNLMPDDVLIARDVEEVILDTSQMLCQRYIPSIPLIEPGDFRLKLARISVAIAARMNSTTGQGQLLVSKDAVYYAAEFIDSLYTSPSLSYKQYSEAFAKYALEGEALEKMKSTFQGQYPYSWKAIAAYAMMNTYITAKEVGIIGNSDTKEVGQALSFLAAHKLLSVAKYGSFIKTEAGARFFEELSPSQKIIPLSARQLKEDKKEADADKEGDDF